MRRGLGMALGAAAIIATCGASSGATAAHQERTATPNGSFAVGGADVRSVGADKGGATRAGVSASMNHSCGVQMARSL